jgi:hypothetical protein
VVVAVSESKKGAYKPDPERSQHLIPMEPSFHEMNQQPDLKLLRSHLRHPEVDLVTADAHGWERTGGATQTRGSIAVIGQKPFIEALSRAPQAGGLPLITAMTTLPPA